MTLPTKILKMGQCRALRLHQSVMFALATDNAEKLFRAAAEVSLFLAERRYAATEVKA